MVYNVLSILDMFCECHMLYSVLHQSIPGHIHCVAVDCIDKALLHLRDICHSTCRELLELGVVNVSPVDCQDVSGRVIGRLEHETVVRGGGGVLYVRRYSLVCVYVGMHLDSAFLLAFCY